MAVEVPKGSGEGLPSDSASPDLTEAISFADFVLDVRAERLLRAGAPVALSPRYFAVLLHLVRHANELVTKDALLDAVWGHRHVSESALRVAINAVRAALGEDSSTGAGSTQPRLLHTVPRRGYRFECSPNLGQTPVTAANLSASDPSPGPRPIGNLPQPPGPLIGREVDVQRIRERLVDGAVLTLHGPGGVGKTHLALVAAAGPAPTHGTWLLRLESMADATPLVGLLARTLQLGPGAAADAAALARALSTMHLRLVLDNAEHLIDAVADLVAEIHAMAPRVQMLLTSQRPLQLRCEQLLPVAPLALPAGGLQAGAVATRESPAARLFIERVQRLQPDFAPDDAALAQVADICRALDGLPLALELAAARVPLLGLQGVSQRLGERLALLVQGPRDAAARHRTLRAALAWTWALLGPADQAVLAALSVFPASFTLPQATSVAAAGSDDDVLAAGDASQALEQLFAHALLQPAADGPLVAADGAASAFLPRWRLLDSVRAFAAEQLLASGRAEAVADRHLEATLALFRSADDRRLSQALRPWMAPLRSEIHSLRQAMQHALAAPGRLDQAVALLAVSAEFRLRAGWRREVLADLAMLKTLVGTPARPDEPPERRLHFDCAAASIGALALPWPVDEELAAAERAEAALIARGDRGRAFRMINNRIAMLQRGQLDLAQRAVLVERMRALEPADGSPYARFSRRWQEGQYARAAGDQASYSAVCAELLADSLALADEHNAWVAAQGLAQAMVVAHRLDEADAVMTQAIDAMRAAGCLREYTTALALLATIRAERSADAATLALVRETVELLRVEDLVWWMADALAWLPAHQGRWADAVQVQAWADDLVRQRGGEKRGPMFAALRGRWQARLQAQPDAAALQRSLSDGPVCTEVEALALVLR